MAHPGGSFRSLAPCMRSRLVPSFIKAYKIFPNILLDELWTANCEASSFDHSFEIISLTIMSLPQNEFGSSSCPTAQQLFTQSQCAQIQKTLRDVDQRNADARSHQHAGLSRVQSKEQYLKDLTSNLSQRKDETQGKNKL
ncbi:hypothetical protein N7G274_003664 [Stereocaulon virgatum]|uniref:Uncharacterized protein n=1 Tax=Stereocaulon virgatum TaxID=373712 RepID=A0ABR4AIV4_9LECA